MNLWAQMLAALPATAQRTIARAQRISLPRQCDAAIRQLRLRQALCHAATVRAVYALLDPAAQAALQHLRSLHGGIRPADLAARYGPIRAWRDLAADPRPRSISEQLLLAASDQPLRRTPAGTLGRATLLRLAPRLAPLPAAEAAALLGWLLPLLRDLDLLTCHQGDASISSAGQRFLARPPADQHAQLRDAWIRAPEPDAWLLRLHVGGRGIDWPLLRRKLCAWAAYLPAGDTREPAVRYADLARSLGPLADAHTHGLRTVDRAPWQPKRAAAVLEAARQGPLAWLGLLGADQEIAGASGEVGRSASAFAAACPPACDDTTEPLHAPPEAPCSIPTAVTRHRMRNPRARRWRWPDLTARVAEEDVGDPAPPTAAPVASCPRWRYAAPSVLHVPYASAAAATLRLLPFAEWVAADAEATIYRITWLFVERFPYEFSHINYELCFARSRW